MLFLQSVSDTFSHSRINLDLLRKLCQFELETFHAFSQVTTSLYIYLYIKYIFVCTSV